MPNHSIQELVSIIIPTFNRGYILYKTLPSYLAAKNVGEIIIVSDGSTDNTSHIITGIINSAIYCPVKQITHEKRLGAAAARSTGLNHATFSYVMFGEDDVYIDADYVASNLNKIIDKHYHFASGRIIYLEKGEETTQAKARFGFGLNTDPLLVEKLFRINQSKILQEDCETVFSHALYVAAKSTLKELGFDQFYRKGAGYREETDTQVQGFLQDKRHCIVHNTFCFHMHFDETPIGGQRIRKISQWFWNIKLNNYFLNKNYTSLRSKGLLRRFSLTGLKFHFFINQTFIFIIRPNFLQLKHLIVLSIKIFTRRTS